MIQEKYNPHEIEAKWQAYWEEHKTFKTEMDSSRPKSYVLEMFPYPSGNLHMGHVRNYSIGDVVARFRTMNGFNVLHPMGWDSFGMPAENAAIKHGIPPKKWTMENIANMTRQQKRLGLSYDWDREVTTCKPDYYKWTQWFFELFYKRGLAVKKKSAVNWCNTCNTVLANEQVIDGKCWRCDHEVVKKDLEQWFFKITDYADELLKDLDLLEGWPERVKTMQRNWIGRSEGLEFSFDFPEIGERIPVYTTRPDTIYGVTYVVLAAEHPLVEKLCVNNPKAEEIKAFCDRVRNQSDIERTSSESEKEGLFTGCYCIHPLTGKKVQVWITNYVLYDYGTGAVMGVPTHDARDWMFADKYGLEKIVVINPKDKELKLEDMTDAYEEKEGVLVNSGEFSGMELHAGMEAIKDKIEAMGIGKRRVNYRLRDWLISRQRYWGAPIPVIYCPDCGEVLVPEDQLPVMLPEDVKFDAGAVSPLATSESFVNCTCPKCGKKAEVYSRITGYYRPVQNWNDGKTQEYKNRKLYDVEHSCMKKVKTSLVTVRKEDVEIKPVESVKYLFTTKTCPNCKIAKEILKGEDYQIIDAEENQDLVRKYGIMQAPTLVVTDGTKAKKYVNASNIKKYVADVKQTV